MLPQPPSDQLQGDHPQTKMAEVPLLGLFFSRITFQYSVIFATLRLVIYSFKIFEDWMATEKYYSTSDINFALISAACLAVPPIFYAIYLVGEHLTRSPTVDAKEVGTKMINGFLLFPWQIKRYLDVLHFAAQRVCLWRPPNGEEKMNLQSIQRTSETLEFFEDLYAGFLQILLQTYLFILAIMTSGEDEGKKQLFRATTLVSSGLSIISMLIAVRRRDDGPMTMVFSKLGWSTLFISRILCISLATSAVGSLVSLIVLLHVAGVTWWVYKIAVDSHKLTDTGPPQASSPSSIYPTAPPAGGDFNAVGDHSATQITRKPCFTLLLVLLFFGIPSLLIWPMMFQLRQRKRPYIYLAIITLENALLLTIWFFGPKPLQGDSLSMLGITALVCTGSGVLFLLLYLCCKPSGTDEQVLYKIRVERSLDTTGSAKAFTGQANRSINATKYGIYYEFCDLVFRLPATYTTAANNRIIQQIIDEVYAN